MSNLNVGTFMQSPTSCGDRQPYRTRRTGGDDSTHQHDWPWSGLFLSWDFCWCIQSGFLENDFCSVAETGETRSVFRCRGGRIFAAYGVMAFILGGSFLDCARDSEHWPWSCYPMYSEIETGTTFDDYRLYGVPKDKSGNGNFAVHG